MMTELARRVLVARLARAYDDRSRNDDKGHHFLTLLGESNDPEAEAEWESLRPRPLPERRTPMTVHPTVVALARKFKEARK